MEVKGIVVKSLDYKENSKIVYIYTKDGMKSVLVKGAKKLKSGFIPVTTTLNLVQVITTDNELPTLIDFSIIDTFENIKNDLKKNLWVNYLLEILYKVSNDVNQEKCFSYLLKTIENLTKGIDTLLLVTIFQLKITYLFGVAPLFKTKEDGDYFSLREGKYTNKLNNGLNKEDSIIFEKMYFFNENKEDFSVFDNIDKHKFFNYVNEYYLYHVDIKIKGLGTVIF